MSWTKANQQGAKQVVSKMSRNLIGAGEANSAQGKCATAGCGGAASFQATLGGGKKIKVCRDCAAEYNS